MSKSRFRNLILIISLVTVFAVLFGATNVVAVADNQSSIGASGTVLEISDVSARPNGMDYSSQTTGRTLKVTMPLSTTHAYIAYEVDIGYDLWAIKGEEDLDKNVPYIEITAENTAFKVTDSKLGEITSSWTNIVEKNGKLEFDLTVHFNGELFVYLTLDGETDPMTDTHIVKEIDYVAPVMRKGVPAHGLKNENGLYVITCTVTFEDLALPSQYGLNSASSGLQAISIMRSDVKLEGDIGEDNLQGLEIVDGGYWEIINAEQMVKTMSLTFNLDKDGYYYYLVIDRLGNVNISMMLGDKFERKNFTDTDDRFMVYNSVGGVNISVKTIMSTIGTELADNEGLVDESIYNATMSAYSTLLLKFYSRGDITTESTEERDELSAEYWSFYNNQYQIFANALSLGATYRVETVNEELLNGKITAINLGTEAFPALAGSEVVASFNVVRYDGKEISEDLKELADLGNDVRAFKISYKLTENGVQSKIPTKAIEYEIVNLKGISKFKFFLKTETGYVDASKYISENSVRFSASYNGAEYYLVYVEESTAQTLLPLWITLGVVGGVALIGGVVVAVLIKKGKIKIKKTKENK